MSHTATGPATYRIASETAVLTTAGWRPAGDLAQGDLLLTADQSVVRTHRVDVELAQPLYLVHLSDGARVEVAADQPWYIQTHNDREAAKSSGQAHRWRQSTTLQLKSILDRGAKRSSYLRMVSPIDFGYSAPLPLDPYALGLLLGDGSFRGGTPTFTKPEPDLHTALGLLLPIGVQTRVRSSNPATLSFPSTSGRNALTAILRDLDLWGHGSWGKFVPDPYLRSTPDARLALLQGLLDTDGWVQISSRGSSSACFSTSSGQLGDNVVELVESLGGTTTVKHRPQPRFQGGVGRPHWVVRVRLPRTVEPFRLTRKLHPWRVGQTALATVPTRRIAQIDYSRVGPTARLTVDEPSGIVLARYVSP
jgi:phosphate starvation-inducible PhoH-like protein